MGQLMVVRRVLPHAPASMLIIGQIAGEEIIFRHCLPLLIGGPIGAIVAGVLFVIMQAFGMPKWRSSVFPIIGAVLMAVARSILYFETNGAILPLIVAHATSFFVATRTRHTV